MGAVDLVIQVESPKSVARGLQRIGRSGHTLGGDGEGARLPEVPRRPARVGRGREGDGRGRDRGDEDPAQPARRARAADRRRSPPTSEITVDELHELVRGAYPFADLSRAPARERARHARRPLPLRRVRGAAAADRLGPHRGRDPRPRGRPPARGHERGHDPRPRPLRRLPRRRRRPRRRARRGDGLRGARRPDLPARRLDLADRGDHPRPRPRLAGAGRAGGGAVLEGRGRRPPVRARREDRPRLPRAGRRCRRRRRSRGSPAEHFLDERAARNLLTFLREQEAATGAVPSDRTIVVERFRDEIGDWRVCILTPFGGRVHAPVGDGARRRGCATRSGSRRRRSGRTTASPSTCPTPTRRRRLDDLLIDPDEIEDLVVAEVGADGALRRALPRERRPGAPDPAPPAGAADAALAAAAEGAVAARRSRAATAPSRSCSRPTASACRTSSTCRR